MDKLLYLGMSAAKQTMHAQSVNTHNLANVNTAGFRADIATFESVPLEGQGFDSRTFVRVSSPAVNYAPGPVNATGRNLDVAIQGEGWLAVQALDGSEAYVRGGDLRISSGGVLTTGSGLPVLGNGGPIAMPPAESVLIGADGTISIRPVGEDETNIIEVDRLKLVNPDVGDLVKGPDGLIRTRDGAEAAADAAVQVATGAKEGSNVNAVEALVQMITLARSYELNVKTMSAAEQNDSADARLLRLGSG